MLIQSQNLIKGIVTDSVTNQALPFVNVFIKGTNFGSMTDNSGKFTLRAPDNTEKINIESMGYISKTIAVDLKSKKNIHVDLAPASYNIAELVVKPKKEKYRKKGNPAVEFVKNVIASKDHYNPYNKDYYSYVHDEIINFALNNFKQEKNKALLKKFKFISNYIDTSLISGKPILSVSSKELIENYYFRKNPRTEKRVVIAKKNAGMDEFLSEDGVEQFLNEVFKDVNIYENNISLFLKRFVSPLSTGGPDFYKYYLQDTVMVAGEKCVDLGFVPFSSESTGFTGHLFITLDSTCFVKKVQLNIPRDINLNFIKNMSIYQEFNRAADGTRLLMKDDIIVDFSILSLSQDLYARRTNTYAHHSFAQPADVSAIFNQKENTLIQKDAFVKPDSFWVKNRLDSVPARERSVDKMMAELRHNPLYFYSEKVFSAMVNGYVNTSPVNNKFTIGPIYSTLSANTTEGLRMRLGGLTTANLSKHWFAQGYFAYGAKDQKVKYDAQLEYSFDKKLKQANEFPVHSIKASYNYDLNRLGQHYLYSTSDNLFLSLKRMPDNRITYLRNIQLSYNHELYSQLSYNIDLRYRTEFASSYVPFVDNLTEKNIGSYSLGELQLRLRYAPGEKFYQTLGKRGSFSKNAPVFTFSHIMALKGILGSDYDYSFTEIGFQKRFWFSAYGNSTVIVKAGKIWTKSPFPMLNIPNANLTYTIQYESYPMMNAMEFINDQFVSWDLNYNMNGLIFNRIPLLKYLKLREIVSFRGIYGQLSKQNDPDISSGLFTFPSDSYKMGKTPYMEAGVGLENIFNFLRIDYVWRLNYLDHPNIDKSGIRISLNFTF